MVTQMQRDNSNLLIFCGQLVAIRSIKEAESLTILVGLAISCLKLILLNNDSSCLLSGLLRLDDIKQQLKSPVRIVSFSFDRSTSQNIVHFSHKLVIIICEELSGL